MRGKSKVSVIVPCFNEHKFLDQVLASVRKQTHPVSEIIIVDDGSTDPVTVEYLDTLPLDVHVVRQENKGLPAARNAGISVAKSDFILPLDCDDWIEENFIKQGLAAIEASKDASFAFSWLKLEAEASGVCEKKYNFFEQLFFNQLPYCLLQPKALWLEIGGYDEEMREGYEDWEYNIRLGKAGYFGVDIEYPLFHYRVQKTGMLASKSRKNHAIIYFYIRSKHADLYSIIRLYHLWRKWRSITSTRPLAIYFFWDLIFRCVPLKVSNWLVKIIFKYLSLSKLL